MHIEQLKKQVLIAREDRVEAGQKSGDAALGRVRTVTLKLETRALREHGVRVAEGYPNRALHQIEPAHDARLADDDATRVAVLQGPLRNSDCR